MNIMNKIGVQPMKAIKGQTGLYFKFADAQGANGSAVELYFKPKFIEAPYEVGAGLLKKIAWIEINILWVGPPEFPDFENGWEVQRDGSYVTKEGQKLKGYLLGKLYLPMGEFNGVLPDMHMWLAKNSQVISDYIQNTLGKQVFASSYMQLQVIFDYMLENVQNDVLKVETPPVFLNKGFDTYQQGIKKAAAEKYAPDAGDHGQDEEDDGD